MGGGGGGGGEGGSIYATITEVLETIRESRLRWEADRRYWARVEAVASSDLE